jgi:hypothetical protein
MEKYHGFDHIFYHFLFNKIVEDGGLRMQIIASDLGTTPNTQLNNFRASSTPKIPSTSTANSTATSLRHSKPSKTSHFSSLITWSSK